MPQNPKSLENLTRAGMGRTPKPNKKTITIRLNRETIEYLDSLDLSRGDSIDGIVQQHRERNVPSYLKDIFLKPLDNNL